MAMTSRDGGKHVGRDRRRLPDGVLGPIKNKPVRLADGTIVSGSSTEIDGSPSVWRVHFERSERPRPHLDDRPTAGGDDGPRTGRHSAGHPGPPGRAAAGRRAHADRSASSRRGPATAAAPWTPLALYARCRIRTRALDAVTLRDGRHVIVYNHTTAGAHAAERRRCHATARRGPRRFALESDVKRGWRPGTRSQSVFTTHSRTTPLTTKTAVSVQRESRCGRRGSCRSRRATTRSRRSPRPSRGSRCPCDRCAARPRRR